ncbi:MAG: hypothetical protein LBD98_02925 [Endomicrobium sp.]|jgi:hypothetical protein|nr:hypothetical protein [Endomicrobium sp.]
MAKDQDIIRSTDTVEDIADIKYFNEYDYFQEYQEYNDYYIYFSTSIPNRSKKTLVPAAPRPRIENIN